MSEGRTRAAEANGGAEDRPVDSLSTGGDGTSDVSGSWPGAGKGDAAGDATASSVDTTTSGVDRTAGSSATSESERAGTTGSAGTTGAAASERGTSEAAAPTVPAANLPGEGSESAPAHGAAASTRAGDAQTSGSTAEGGGLDRAQTGQPGGQVPGAGDGDNDSEWADAEDKAYKKELRKGFGFGAAGGILVGAVVALLLGALVWPGYLLGPGNPDDTASQVTQALSSKDGPKLDELSCKGPDGKPVAQLSGQVLQFIAKVAPTGPANAVIDTEARAPVDLTLSVQGQSQTLPSELVLGEVKGDWCLKGLAQRQ